MVVEEEKQIFALVGDHQSKKKKKKKEKIKKSKLEDIIAVSLCLHFVCLSSVLFFPLFPLLWCDLSFPADGPADFPFASSTQPHHKLLN